MNRCSASAVSRRTLLAAMGGLISGAAFAPKSKIKPKLNGVGGSLFNPRYTAPNHSRFLTHLRRIDAKRGGKTPIAQRNDEFGDVISWRHMARKQRYARLLHDDLNLHVVAVIHGHFCARVTRFTIQPITNCRRGGTERG